MTRRHALFLVALWSAAGGIRSALAQREPVLKQVAVPHAYYWREMYVPQVTSGPSAVTWSPDGTELIYSMQGSLWRQRIGSRVAQQLTAGEGDDYQPDWSPDGRLVVFARYAHDAIELQLLDLDRVVRISGEHDEPSIGGPVGLIVVPLARGQLLRDA